MIDTHSHLFDETFINDLDDCIARCLANNIKKIVLVGFSKETNKLAYEMSLKHRIFYPTAGIHPSETKDDVEESLRYLENWINSHHVYAIGECGLDYHYGKNDIELQKKLFFGQINLAVKYDLPLIIHMRDATLDTYEILKPFAGKVRGVMHCYSGSYEMALKFIELGFYISIGGPVTFKNAVEPKKVASLIDVNKLLVETDCPYLAPVPKRGQRNESSFVVYTALEIANQKKISYSELEKILDCNATELFRLEE